MILEGVIGVSALYTGYRVLDYENRIIRRQKRAIRSKWNMLLDAMGTKAENDIKQKFQLQEIFLKDYGFDLNILIPLSKSYLDVMALLPSLEVCFKGRVMINRTSKFNSVYLRVHESDKEISFEDNLKFNWFKTFYNLDCKNKDGEIIEIKRFEDITAPNGEVVGFKVISKIPLGSSYEKIKGAFDIISKTMGKCFTEFDNKLMELIVSIVHIPMGDGVEFIPVNVKPWELYVAMGYDWNPIILDYSFNANALIGGMQGTGKTMALISAFVNLCKVCDGDYFYNSFDLYIANMGQKEDLRVFKMVKQCKYYAGNKQQVLSALRHLMKEMDRRNKLFSKQKELCFNMHQYNKVVKHNNQKLKTIHLIGDEIADFMESEDIQKLFWEIVRKGRSAGIYVTMATQRGSLKNLDSEIKGQLGNQIAFFQPNTASALTIVSGEDNAKRVIGLETKRECLVSYAGGSKVARTLFLDIKLIQTMLAKVTVEDDRFKIKLDNSGNIIKEKEQPNATEIPSKDKDEKNIRFTNINKKGL